MTWLTVIGLLIFLIGSVVYRVIMTRALARLDDAAKLRMINTIPQRNLRMSIILVVTVIIWAVVVFIFPRMWFYLMNGFFLLLLLFLIATFASNYKKLQELSVSPDYLRSYMKGVTFIIAGMVALIALTFYPIFY